MNKTSPSRKNARIAMAFVFVGTMIASPFLSTTKKSEASPPPQDSTNVSRIELYQDNDDLYSNDGMSQEDLTMVTQMAYEQSQGFQPH